MTQKNTLGRHERLKSRKAIGLLFSKGQQNFHYPFKCLYNIKPLPEKDNYPLLFSVSIPQKKVKSAVKRNLLKRRSREAFRLNNHTLKLALFRSNLKIELMFVYLGSEIENYSVIEKSIIKHIHALQKLASS